MGRYYMLTVPVFVLTGSISIVIKDTASIGAAITGFVLGPPVGTILAVVGITLTLRKVIRVLKSMRRTPREGSSNISKKRQENRPP